MDDYKTLRADVDSLSGRVDDLHSTLEQHMRDSDARAVRQNVVLDRIERGVNKARPSFGGIFAVIAALVAAVTLASFFLLFRS